MVTASCRHRHSYHCTAGKHSQFPATTAMFLSDPTWHLTVCPTAPPHLEEARRAHREKAETPWELLSLMKSQDWLPPKESVRQLLCADPCCHICNDAALEIRQLLSEENLLTIPPSVGQPSSHIETSGVSFEMSMSRVSFEPTLELHSQHSRESLITPRVSQLTDQNSLQQIATPSLGMISIQDYWTEHLDLEQGFQLPDVARDPGTVSPSMMEEFRSSVNDQETVNTSCNYVQENQDQQYIKSHVPLLAPNIELPNETYPMALHMVLPAHLPFLSPEVLRFLEVHVKKWMHFQRWGLPRRVEESLRQLMPNPPLLHQPGDYQPVSLIINETSDTCMETIYNIPHDIWGSCMIPQPTQAFWVTEWSISDPKQSQNYQETPNPLTLALPSPDFKLLNGLYTQHGKQTEDPENHLQKHSQLFCGLPCLHSESLVTSFMESQDLSTNRSMSESSFLSLLPNSPSQSTPPPSPPTPNWESLPDDHQQIQINFPFLTLAQYETLEWHLLQRQLQIRWDLPTVFQGSQYDQGPMLYESYVEVQTPKTEETSWLEKPVSVLTKELLFFPDHSRRLLEFHLQKKLIYYHWGLPQKIKQSMQLLLSPANRQPLPWNTTTSLNNVSSPQPEVLEANEVSDSVSLTLAPGPPPLTHLLTQAKVKLQSHIHSKCWQIRQGNIPTRICVSWDSRIPGSLAVAPSPCTPESKPLETQAATDPDFQQTLASWIPTAIEQQQQTSPGAVLEHTKLSQSLSKGAIQKLETALRHKYLAFLSGLPALYYVALSKALVPKIPSQSIITEIVPESVEATTESLTAVTSGENQCTDYGPDVQEHKTSSAFDPEWVRLKDQLVRELKAVQHGQKQTSSRASGSSQGVPKFSKPTGDIIGAQVLCVEVQGTVNSPSLEEAWYPESTSPNKSKDSVQVPMLPKNKEHPGKLKPAGDHGEGDAGFGLPSTKGNTHPAKDQRAARTLLDRTSQESAATWDCPAYGDPNFPEPAGPNN
ncbi:protein SPATA31F1 [Rhynchocyon petersi]